MTILSRGEIESAKLAFKLIRGPEARLEFCKRYLEDVFDTVDGLYAENGDMMDQIDGQEDGSYHDDCEEIRTLINDMRSLQREERLTTERLTALTTEIEWLLLP